MHGLFGDERHALHRTVAGTQAHQIEAHILEGNAAALELRAAEVTLAEEIGHRPAIASQLRQATHASLAALRVERIGFRLERTDLGIDATRGIGPLLTIHPRDGAGDELDLVHQIHGRARDIRNPAALVGRQRAEQSPDLFTIGARRPDEADELTEFVVAGRRVRHRDT